MMDNYHFLQSCMSKPKTVRDLKVGDAFIFFPCDGDDHGHGGFRSGCNLFVKIEPRSQGEGYHPDYLVIAREYDRGGEINGYLDRKVIQIHGVK